MLELCPGVVMTGLHFGNQTQTQEALREDRVRTGHSWYPRGGSGRLENVPGDFQVSCMEYEGWVLLALQSYT